MQDKFALTVIIGLTIFGLFFIAGQELDLDTGEAPDEMTLYERSHIQAGEAQQDFRNINFGDISVGKTRGDIQVFRDRDMELTDRFTGGWRLALDYEATEPQGGEIKFDVLGREGDGTINIYVNNQKIFEEYMIGGSTQEVEIPERALRNGENQIEMRAERDGIIGLLNSVRYTLEDVEITVNDRKFHDHRNSFRLFGYELEEFDTSELTFTLPTGNIQDQPLKVDINNNQVYNQQRVRGDEEITITPENANLQPGHNNIRFYTERDAEYHLENTQLTVRHIGVVSPETVELNFQLNQTQLDYKDRSDTKTRLQFNYQPLVSGRDELQLNLNNNQTTYTPQTGRNTIEVNPNNLQRDNKLTIDSEGAYTLNNLRIRSVKEEDN